MTFLPYAFVQISVKFILQLIKDITTTFAAKISCSNIHKIIITNSLFSFSLVLTIF